MNYRTVSAKTIVETVLAVADCKPSSKSAFRLVTRVVEVTARGAVPVAMLLTNCVPVIVPVDWSLSTHVVAPPTAAEYVAVPALPVVLPLL